MAVYPNLASTDSDLYVAVNQKSTTLTDNPLAAGAATVNVNDASAFPSTGAITIDAEIIKYTGKTATSFTGCTRGFDGTFDVQHSVNTPVYHRIIADHHNVLKEEIKAVEADLVALQSALNDADTPASTATDVKDRLDQIVSQIKVMTGETNWYDAPDATITALKSSVDAKLPLAGGTMAGNIAMGGNKLTGLAAGSGAGDSVRYEQALLLSLGGIITAATSIRNTDALHLEGNDPNNQHALLTIDTREAGANFRGWTFLAGKNADTAWGSYSLRLYPYSTGAIDGDLVFASGAAASIRLGHGQAATADATTGFSQNAEIKSTGCSFKGTNTNDSAAAGYIGEYIESVVTSATNLPTSGQLGDLTSISLSAGDWDIGVNIGFSLNTGTGMTRISGGIGTASGNSTTGIVSGSNFHDSTAMPTAAANSFVSVAPYRVSISSSTTYYLKFRGNYTGGNPQGVGRISARRVR